ncbi:hypothetical protein GF312_13550 [Candidatus Poribacteria bacterium]|nr:hypothetical protein [Candidatus Poribacteria bacterium]
MCEILDHQISTEGNIVNLWTTKYIRFNVDEKKMKYEKYWIQKVKAELYEKFKQIKHNDAMILRGTYKSKETPKGIFPDIENILFYNIGGFGTLCRRGLIFEGLPQWMVKTVSLPEPPCPLISESLNYYRYEMVSVDDQEPRLWDKGDTLASWVKIPFESSFFTESSTRKACIIWSALRSHANSINVNDNYKLPIERGVKFGIRLKLHLPISNTLNIDKAKSLIDGTVVAFQGCNNGNGIDYVVERIYNISEVLKGNLTPGDIKKYLTFEKYRKLEVLWSGKIMEGKATRPRWAPDDDFCVFGSVVLDNTPSSDYMFSGCLFEIKERRP